MSEALKNICTDLILALEGCLASLERADCAENVCCCGDDMARHSDPMHAGHVPTDMGVYYASQAAENARATISASKALLK
jgi:hypothetical protein